MIYYRDKNKLSDLLPRIILGTYSFDRFVQVDISKYKNLSFALEIGINLFIYYISPARFEIRVANNVVWPGSAVFKWIGQSQVGHRARTRNRNCCQGYNRISGRVSSARWNRRCWKCNLISTAMAPRPFSLPAKWPRFVFPHVNVKNVFGFFMNLKRKMKN